MIGNTHPMNSALRALDLIGERQKALACNLANMDTPNYRRKDVSFTQYLAGVTNPLETKLAAKMGPSPVAVETSMYDKVDPATELSEMQKNSVMYTVAARRMTSLITEMKTVINMGNS